MNVRVLVTSKRCERSTLEKWPYATFLRQPVTPDAWCSLVFGTLMILVSFSEISRTMFDRVSSSPKKLVSTYTRGS